MTDDHTPGSGAEDPARPLPLERAAVDRQGDHMESERESTAKRGQKRRQRRSPTMTIKAPSYAGGMYHDLPSLGGATYTHPDDR